MKRVTRPLLVILMIAALLVVAGCKKQVEVRTGTKTLCRYGHVVTDDTHTIKVPAEKAGEYRVSEVTITCDLHKKLETLYAQAQLQITSGDLDAASKVLEQVVAGDANFRSAKKQLDAIKAGGKPVPDDAQAPSTPTTSTPEPGATPTGPIEALLVWTPDSLTGFTAGKPLSDALTVTREYLSAGGDAAAAVIVAEQYPTAAAAKAALDGQIKRAYPSNASAVTVKSHPAYFGTDARRFAAVAFTQDAILVVVEIEARSGVSPASLKSFATSVAGQLP